jgi:hypothetical protein
MHQQHPHLHTPAYAVGRRVGRVLGMATVAGAATAVAVGLAQAVGAWGLAFVTIAAAAMLGATAQRPRPLATMPRKVEPIEPSDPPAVQQPVEPVTEEPRTNAPGGDA